MNWTTEAPKQDGWYWWRRDEMDPPEVVQLQRGTVMWAGDDEGTMAGGISGEFLGPLDPSQVLAYESLVKELHLTRLALDEAAKSGFERGVLAAIEAAEDVPTTVSVHATAHDASIATGCKEAIVMAIGATCKYEPSP